MAEALSHRVLARITPPRPPRSAVPRPRLAAQLEQAAQGRLTLVVAGAGYGKTTVLCQMAASATVPVAWCSCDAALRSAEAFSETLIAAIGTCVPGFGETFAPIGTPAVLAELVIGEIGTLVSDALRIVIDDAHLLEDSPAMEVLGALVGMGGPDVHLLVGSRTALDLRIARLRAEDEVTDLGPAHLAFDEDDARLFAPRLPSPDDAELARALGETGGWPAAFVLAVRRHTPSGAAGDAQEGYVFDYLAQEVLAELGASAHAQLSDLAVLERVNPQLAQAVTGSPEAIDLLRRLASEHLLVQRMQGEQEWYRLHGLLRRYLAAEDAQGQRERHRRAAAGWSAVGEPVQAIPHLLGAGEHRDAARILATVADAMALSPESDTLAGWLDELDDATIDAHPELILARGVISFARGEMEESFSLLEAAILTLVERGDHDRAATALVRLWQSMNVAGTPVRDRVVIAERLLGLIEPDAQVTSMVRLQIATGRAWAGDPEPLRVLCAQIAESERTAPAALAAFARAARAFLIDYPAGRTIEAALQLDALRSRLDIVGGRDAGTLTAFVAGFRAIVLNDVGRFEEALVEAERCRAGALRYGFAASATRTIAWLHAAAFAGLGRFDEIAEATLEPPTPTDGHSQSHYAYRLLSVRATVAAARDDAKAVEDAAATASVAIEAQGPEVDQPSALSDIADAAVVVGSRALAVTLAEQALGIATALTVPRSQARAAIQLAAWAPTVAGGMAVHALEITDRIECLDLWTRRCAHHAHTVLAVAFVTDERHDRLITRILQACGRDTTQRFVTSLDLSATALRERVASMLGDDALAESGLVSLRADRDPTVRRRARQRRSAPKEARPALAYHGLGGFRVIRDGQEVPRGDFGREKARALLASLLCARRPVHREELLEWHWPDLPPDRGTRAFHVTMHGLRRALEPHLQRGTPSTTVIAEGDAYRVDLDGGDTFDAAALMSAGEEDLETLQELEASYRGPLFPEWSYAEWSEPLRREAEGAFHNVVETLGREMMRRGRPREAMPRFEVLTREQPEREEWHRLLMQALALAGERALALRQFHACRAVSRRELGVEPSAETHELYRSILKEETDLAVS